MKRPPVVLVAVMSLLAVPPALRPERAFDAKVNREEGEFRIYVAQKEIGTEKFEIVRSEDSSSSSSVLEFRDPEHTRQKMHFESRLEMNGRYIPRSYELKTDIDGKKASILGTFPPNEALFEYRAGDAPRKTGFLVGDSFTLLDSNIYHHFIFLARLFDLGGDKMQKFQVVIPQEGESGILKISRLSKETIAIKNRRVDANQLQVDSGSLIILLWVDDRHLLYKIAVKQKGLEVIRDP